MNIKQNKKGFSLIEVAVALVILGLILASFGNIFKLVSSTDRVKEQQTNTQRIQKTLNTFFAVNGFLPCPDTDHSGKENRVGARCSKKEGYLPYRDLGLEQFDAWGNEYYYRVNAEAGNSSDINNICKSASVLGRSGAHTTTGIDELKICSATNTFFCDAAQCLAHCDDSCEPINLDPPDPRYPFTAPGPPYVYFATPPYDDEPGTGNLFIKSETGMIHGGSDGDGTVALVVSWGANGDQVYRYLESDPPCTGGTIAESENCNGDAIFVETKTGESRDYITWFTVNQAKMALIYNGDFKW